MMQRKTCSASGVSRAALFDEIEKIAEATPKKSRWPRALKSAAGYALGYAAGHGAGMLIDKGLQKALKDKYPKISPEVKKKLLFPLMGAATVGVMAAHNYTAERQRRLVEQDE
jgi:hypothetical protein